MELIKPTQITPRRATSQQIEFLKALEDKGVLLRFKLGDILASRGIHQQRFREITGLKITTVRNLLYGLNNSISFHHILIIMFVLGITDITEIFDIYIPDRVKDDLEMSGNAFMCENDVNGICSLMSDILNNGK